MAHVRIHQDIANYERRRKGFTNRQIAYAIVAAVVLAVLCALFGYLFELPWDLALPIAVIPALLFILAGFFPIQNMPAEEFVERFIAQQKRGRVLLNEGDESDWEGPFEGKEVTRGYKKKARKRGSECARTE